MTTDNFTAALGMVEAKRVSNAEPELEAELSVNDWVDRIKAAAMTAHGAARAGVWAAEADAWTDLAAIALGRIEYLLAHAD